MENRETSGTLEEGFVESKLGQDDKILEEEDSVSLFNLSEKRTFDAYRGNNEVGHLDLARKLGNGSMEESRLCDACPNDKLFVVSSNKVKGENVSILEEDSKGSGNDRVHVSKSDELLHSHGLFPMEKDDDVLHLHEPGSPTKIEVSGSGINLFVEVFGPLDGVSKGDNNLNDKEGHALGESDYNQEVSLEENGTIFRNVSAKNEGDNVVGEQEFAFDVGDLVWVKTRTQTWWPGMVSNPANALNDAKSEKRGSFLVKYFGSANYVWFENSDLRPFVEYFQQMSGQNNSRSFFGSVERALCEIGQRVKLTMTCPCFSKDCQALAAQSSTENRKENSVSMDKINKLDRLSLSRFEPSSFVSHLRDLARSVNVPARIELIVMKNRLSAFHCSIGHRDLPLQMLMDEGHHNISGGGKNSSKARDSDRTISTREKRNHVDDGDLGLGDKTASPGKGSEHRERKKSKYLSYPYVDVNRGLNVASTLGQETEDTHNRSSLSTKSTPLGSCSSTNSRKKGSKKPLKVHNMVCKATDDINACSADLLSELHVMARDCFYLSRSKYSDSLTRFYSSFRIFAFLNVDLACKDAGVQPAPDLEKCLAENSTESAAQMEGTKVKKEAENGRVNLSSVKETVENAESDKSSKTDDQKGKGNVIHKKPKKKKGQVPSATLGSTNNSFKMGGNDYPKSSWLINFQLPPSDVPKSITTPKIVQDAITPRLPQIDPIAKLPDLNGSNPSNGNNPSFSVDHVPVGGPSITLGKSLPEQTKEQLVSPSIVGANQMVFATVPSLTVHNITQFNNGVNGASQYWNGGFTARELESNVMINKGLGSFVQQSLQMAHFSSAAKPKRRKRKREEKNAPAIPDLNGNVLDTSSSGKTLPEGNPILSPVGETQHKRRNKSANTESGSSTKTNSASTIPPPPGGSIILNFAPETTLPSKETLVSTFSRFGLLKESETQVLNDSSVQIAYERISEARFAYRSLEKNNPFGASLASFKLDCEPAALRIKEKKKNFQNPRPFVPVDASKNPAKNRETPDIAFMKQNVEMMKMTLEKVGNNLSAEMRAKLENEIKVFLDKINSVAAGSSST
ncbi:Non-specific serine/threonine protein kinase [Handroanthus impetiginosus]|uniref:Non-specific serine/threonine protein kinase n=1 Tax=Handroanthus impetiginosus TaxID=429701 RepID=A0A2G9HDA5_9LAMI|nr:Non-specific serine/threonine protein kinase [Handroanthus impetiginosus]